MYPADLLTKPTFGCNLHEAKSRLEDFLSIFPGGVIPEPPEGDVAAAIQFRSWQKQLRQLMEERHSIEPATVKDSLTVAPGAMGIPIHDCSHPSFATDHQGEIRCTYCSELASHIPPVAGNPVTGKEGE